MPTVRNRGASLFYSAEVGNGDEGPPVVFVNEAGLGGWLWGWQHASLAGPFETVVWDLRGTGRSEGTAGPYDLETLASDFEAVCREIDGRSVHAVGLGLGGAIALEAARSSGRVETLTLLGTAAHGSAFDLEALFEPPVDNGEATVEGDSGESSVDDDSAASDCAGDDRRDAIRSTLESALSADFRDRQPDVVDGIVDWRLEGDADLAGRRAQLAALAEFDARDWLVEVTQPTLVVHGTADALVLPDAGRDLADGLPRGTFVPLEGAGHLANVERSRAVNDRFFGFLEDHTDDLER
ncbi:alpha/beta fold hydrolase [Natronosalvus halobius]|uniref:alpha/beta fold hydrolase n=1 Tax=Natronosalvus halobius TaxID=2953746 RepID=UPI00209C88B2|nr:alpha/beta fold hydrolase [Natronosalvus halobius]USZ70632.1 alpha/beta hydrolase [Natronosalvus halobius]